MWVVIPMEFISSVVWRGESQMWKIIQFKSNEGEVSKNLIYPGTLQRKYCKTSFIQGAWGQILSIQYF